MRVISKISVTVMKRLFDETLTVTEATYLQTPWTLAQLTTVHQALKIGIGVE